MERGKAALTCRRFKGRHTHDMIAIELDNIHSSYAIKLHQLSQKKALILSWPSKDFSQSRRILRMITDINDILQNSGGDGGGDEVVMITLLPHQRSAAHTLNLVSCTDVDKWLLSKQQTKAIYTNAITKCTG